MAGAVQTIQNAQFAFPVTAKDIPPEGQMGIQIPYSLSPTNSVQAFSYALNSASGFKLSQVVTLIIDNTQNPQSVSVIHGITGSTVQVPAGVEYIVPTFSNSGPYLLDIQTLTPPTSVCQTIITFLNYDRLSEFGTSQNIIQGSSTIGSSFVNTYAQFGADTAFAADIVANEVVGNTGSLTLTGNMPSFNKQGYAITMFTITCTNLGVSGVTGSPVFTNFEAQFGTNSNSTAFGQWAIPTTGTTTGILASVGNLSLQVPGSGYGVITLTTQWTPGSDNIQLNGSIYVLAYGIILPYGA